MGFSGLNVAQANELRRKVRESDSSYLVVKNRLASRAVKGTVLEPLADLFQGPTAVAYNEHDALALTKLLSEYAKANPELTLRAGVIEGAELLDEEGLNILAKLPGLQELRAQLLSLFQAPATGLVRLLATPGTQLVQVIEARKKNLEEAGG